MNIALIGMPASGKTFIGKPLAQRLGYAFLDPDKIMEAEFGKPLQGVLEELGDVAFLKKEWDTTRVATLGKEQCVISTGGSIVLTPDAMEYLATIALIIYLQVPLKALTERIGDIPRGTVGAATKTLAELFAERDPLYRKWANVTIVANREGQDVLEDILASIP